MKQRIVATVLAVGLAASPAFAQDTPHQHGPTSSGSGQTEPRTGMMMGSEAMLQHQRKMAEMRATMQQANAATDPAERKRLMSQHRQMMHERMASMMQADHAAMMQVCQERMAMMHDIMGQMTAHHQMMPSK